MTNTPSSRLDNFLETVEGCDPLYQLYQHLLIHESAFANAELPTKTGLTFEHHGVDIIYPLLDAVAYGILDEQETHSSPLHFTTSHGFSSTKDVIKAQTHADIALYLWYRQTLSADVSIEEYSPPPATFQTVAITGLLHTAITFGRHWERSHDAD